MQPTDTEIEAILKRLAELGASSEQGADDSASAWIDSIKTSRSFLQDHSHRVVFVGEAGVGKSSLVAVAARLLLTGDVPTTKSALKNQSVLAIGAGRTTVCEVEIRPALTPQERQQLNLAIEPVLGLMIDPMPAVDMDGEIKRWAEDEWRRRQPGARLAGETDSLPTAQEVARALRAMTGYAEYVTTVKEGDVTRRPTVKPIDEVVPKFATLELFTEHLRTCANLSARSQTAWWWNSDSPDAWSELKSTVEEVNEGKNPSAMLPARMTLVVPSSFLDAVPGLELRFIDTRGLDAGVGVFAREDLQSYVSDPRAVIVICAPFKSAPGEEVRTMLRAIKEDARWRSAFSRTVLVLLDHDDANQVNGAGGDRLAGQEIKISECRVALSDAGLDGDISQEQIVAMDVLIDQRARLVDAIRKRLVSMRSAIERKQLQQYNDARQFVARHGDAQRVEQQQEIDNEIRLALSENMPQGLPLSNSMKGLFDAIQVTRYASVIYATCRRSGFYPGLNLYKAISAEASRSATAWVDPAINAVLLKLEELTTDISHTTVLDHVRLRQTQFNEARINFVDGYAKQVLMEVFSTLSRADVLWRACCSEWGSGGGFTTQVLARLEAWSKVQNFSAHEKIESVVSIPFWPDVVRPTRATRFTLHARNLRALRTAVWQTEPVSLLIGANGAGKTTLLQVLKLLRLAYERGLPEAVRIVFGGSSNLRSWGAVDDDPIEIGLDVGDASWRIQLVPREGSVDSVAKESLIDQSREVFSRDSLGGFRYKNESIPTTNEYIGLRVLVDRGAIDRPIREIANFLQRVAVYQEPDLWTLRSQGSDATDDRDLQPRGANVLAILRRWHQDRTQQHRYEFVIGGMASAFPKTFKTLDFQGVATTLAARVYRPNSELPSQLAHEANGVLQMLVLLCDIASANEGGVVAIDEPENGLHPYALRAFLRKANQWANRHHVTVLLATHSTVLLDEFSGNPNSVYVMKAPPGGEATIPTRLDQLCDREWLEGFKLGDLYEQGEIGSNEDEV